MSCILKQVYNIIGITDLNSEEQDTFVSEGLEDWAKNMPNGMYLSATFFVFLTKLCDSS